MATPLADRTGTRLALIAALFVALLAAQAGAVGMMPAGGSVRTDRVLGRASFAYLSGLRVFAAAVLWNRLEPQFDLYYSKMSMADQKQMLPVIRIVQKLDPQFVQAYYIASWVVARHGDSAEAMAICREGIRNNPKSGLLRTNYVENMLLQDNARVAQGEGREFIAQAVVQADVAMGADTVWADAAEQTEGYMVAATAYDLAGLKDKAEAARAAAGRLRESAPAGAEGE